MSRKKSIETEELIRLFEEYRIENGGEKVSIPKFCRYLNNKGIDVKEYTLRRYKEFRKYMDDANSESAQKAESDVVAYKTLDVDEFLDKNRSKERLRKALIVRDQYYAKIASRAADAIKERKKLEEKVKELEGRIDEFVLMSSNAKKREDNAEIRKKNSAIVKLRALLESYVYPDAANAILEKAGILEVVNSIVPDEAIKGKMIEAETEVKPSRFDSLNELTRDFYE